MWPAYRLVLTGKCTWTEVATLMSIDDIYDMNDLLTQWGAD